MAEMGKDYTVNEFGEIVHLNGDDTKNKSAGDELFNEHAQLEYEIFSHPDRFSPEELEQKKARYAELSNQLGLNKRMACKNATLELRKKLMQQQNKQLSPEQIISLQQREND